MQKRFMSLCIVSTIAWSLGTTDADAAGFQLAEQNGSGLGNAYAGSAAIAENASTVFFNPAGMTRLPGVNISGGAAIVKPSFSFSNNGSTGPTSRSLGSNTGGDAGSVAALPNAYVSWQLDPKWFVGLGVGAPFGLKTEYDNDWIGRYQSNRFGIETINVNPSVAYRVNDRLSVGAGVNWQHLDADYRRSVPAAGLISGLPGGMSNPFAGTVFNSPDLNGKIKLKGDAWGWNLGLLYELTPDTRVGLAYRSKMRFHATGTTTLDNLPLGLASRSADASASVTLPDTATFSVVHDINSQWQVLADLSWTGWSSIQSLDIDSGALGANNLELEFRDTWRVALGANYKYNEKWLFKGGVAYDQTPVPGRSVRPVSLPDNDRIWVSLGAQYNIGKQTTVDVGYAHLFLPDSSINNSASGQGTVKGKYSASIDIIGVQLSHRF